MCEGANDILKKPLYDMARQGSRSIAEVGRGTGWDWLKNEGKSGEKNPGYALTRAAETAGLAMGAMYAPELYAAMASSPEAYAAVTPGVTASGQQAAMLAAQTGDFGAKGLLATSAAGGNPMANMVLGSMGRVVCENDGGLQGLKMMFPDQQNARPAPAPPMQGQQGPLPSMYSGHPYQARPMANTGPYGTEAGNSLGFTEEQKRKLRELGYPI
jgi:hypothetical protein